MGICKDTKIENVNSKKIWPRCGNVPVLCHSHLGINTLFLAAFCLSLGVKIYSEVEFLFLIKYESLWKLCIYVYLWKYRIVFVKSKCNKDIECFLIIDLNPFCLAGIQSGGLNIQLVIGSKKKKWKKRRKKDMPKGFFANK